MVHMTVAPSMSILFHMLVAVSAPSTVLNVGRGTFNRQDTKMIARTVRGHWMRKDLGLVLANVSSPHLDCKVFFSGLA